MGEQLLDETPLGRFVLRLTAAAALLGGVSLVLVTAITVLSVIGRALIPLGLRPIPGDVELVQAGILFAVFVFLPWCHVERGHAIVAILTDRFPVRFNAVAEFVWDVTMFVAAVFIAWRLWVGLTDKFANGESSFILRMPLWMIYAGGLFGAVIFVIATAYCAARSLANARSANPLRPLGGAGE